MIDAVRLEKIRMLIEKTVVLDDPTRQKLLDKLPKLTEEKMDQLEQTITDADAQLKKIDAETQKRIDGENARYLETLKEFRMKTIPQALKIAEKEHRMSEEAEAEELLQQAANL